MNVKILFLPILLPFLAGILCILGRKQRIFAEGISLVAAAINLFIAFVLFGKNINFNLPWLSFGIDVSLRLYHFSAFIILAAAGFGFLITLYSLFFMRAKEHLGQFYAYLLISVAFINGAVLADNLVVLLFFWEGLLMSLFGMIAIGNKNAFKTATKAFVINGVTDLCMMIGIVLTAHLAGTLTISKINLPLGLGASIAFILLMIGAISKAGSMPFHSWIPDAATDAPLPFMALVPAALEKLLGIYFLARISLDMFQLTHESWLSVLLMTVGVITILLAVMMALVQKDYKRLLSYHAISQVGYMILGIGTAIPIGIIGGLFHMINHAMYKSCLFLTGGSVEKQVGTTNLEKLGGLGIKMPVTLICFVITAASISGVWPFNGFFSKELVYDAALERGLVFYLCAIAGSFFTAASFLKLGHAAFFGKPNPENNQVKEAPLGMLVPMIVIAAGCIIFGVFNSLPLKYLITPILGAKLNGHHFAGMPANIKLVVISVIVLVAAIVNHIFGASMKGSGLKALDYIRYAPILSGIYNKAEKKFFDPYEIGLKIVNLVSTLSWKIDRGIDWVYDKFSVKTIFGLSMRIRNLQNGNYSLYLVLSIVSAVLVFVLFFAAL
ncbi:MAG: NADH-quinone oxidoreductase subunit L [Candidatus Omnitrophica bacterium]|nr:NADH-quinone oxidoreductase subunit L [Candidatus Omnitrophota bacterium]